MDTVKVVKVTRSVYKKSKVGGPFPKEILEGTKLRRDPSRVHECHGTKESIGGSLRRTNDDQ